MGGGGGVGGGGLTGVGGGGTHLMLGPSASARKSKHDRSVLCCVSTETIVADC